MEATRPERMGSGFSSAGGNTKPPDEASRRKPRQPALSSLGALVLDRIALASEACAEQASPRRRIVNAEFLVVPGGLCVPTEGRLRIEEVQGVDYVIGRSTWEPCRSPEAAQERLAKRIRDLDPHELALEAVALDEPIEEAQDTAARR